MKVGDDGKMTESDGKKEDIAFGVEDEHGKQGEVEIDAAEEVNLIVLFPIYSRNNPFVWHHLIHT